MQHKGSTSPVHSLDASPAGSLSGMPEWLKDAEAQQSLQDAAITLGVQVHFRSEHVMHKGMLKAATARQLLLAIYTSDTSNAARILLS